ncbi:MAG: hypothetical protein ABI633_05260 [Burkholderiales bacterium]
MPIGELAGEKKYGHPAKQRQRNPLGLYRSARMVAQLVPTFANTLLASDQARVRGLDA